MKLPGVPHHQRPAFPDRSSPPLRTPAVQDHCPQKGLHLPAHRAPKTTRALTARNARRSRSPGHRTVLANLPPGTHRAKRKCSFRPARHPPSGPESRPAVQHRQPCNRSRQNGWPLPARLGFPDPATPAVHDAPRAHCCAPHRARRGAIPIPAWAGPLAGRLREPYRPQQPPAKGLMHSTIP